MFLTDDEITKLTPRDERYEVADEKEPGLRVRVYPNGTRAWSYWYRNSHGDPRRLKLGKYPGVTLAKARKMAKAHAVAVDKGSDPAAERNAMRAARHARKTAATFADVCVAFAAEELPKFRPATRSGWQRYIDREIVPRLGKLRPEELTAEHVAELKDAIARGERGPIKEGKPTWKRKPAPRSARNCFDVARRILEWLSAVDADVEAARKRHGLTRLAANPAATARGYVRRRRATRAESAAKALTDDQLRAVFQAAAQEAEAAATLAKEWKQKHPDATATERADSTVLRHAFEASAHYHLLALVAHTAVRAHDARAARWQDVNEPRKLWTVPEHKTSGHTGAPHVVPLSVGAMAVLARIRKANLAAGYGKSPWLFPAETTSCEVCERGGHIDKDAKGTRRIKVAAGVEGRGLLHRLRDTIKTRMSEQGIDGRVSEAILAHVPAGIVGVYDHAELLPQRQDALRWWSDELGRILKAA